ncbi:MAG: glycerophosphodiester phosphodiesterase family protein [Pseudomonadota bacterium]
MKRLLLLFLALALVLYLVNASWFASPLPDGELKLISHRGVHQTYDRTDLDRDACTATRIYPPKHAFLENTIPSMAAAFSAGADIVELDVHPTTDGKFAVFHDWTLDCRTNESGVTRNHSLKDLKALDIGYGYTADGGKSYPFRGTASSRIPSLKEVLAAFPHGQFLINFKSKDVREAEQLEELLLAHPDWRPRIWGVYGGDEPTRQMGELVPGIRNFTKSDTKSCLMEYLALGWSGYVPEPCRGRQILVPSNYAPWLWGWPNRFLKRMNDHDTEVLLAGSPNGSGGIDSLEQLHSVPDDFSGYVWTNKIEIIGPMLGGRPNKKGEVINPASHEN